MSPCLTPRSCHDQYFLYKSKDVRYNRGHTCIQRWIEPWHLAERQPLAVMANLKGSVYVLEHDRWDSVAGAQPRSQQRGQCPMSWVVWSWHATVRHYARASQPRRTGRRSVFPSVVNHYKARNQKVNRAYSYTQQSGRSLITWHQSALIGGKGSLRPGTGQTSVNVEASKTRPPFTTKRMSLVPLMSPSRRSTPGGYTTKSASLPGVKEPTASSMPSVAAASDVAARRVLKDTTRVSGLAKNKKDVVN